MARNPRKQALNHLHYLSSKINYVENALRKNLDIEQTYYQLLAAQALIKKTVKKYFDDLLRSKITLQIQQLLQQCPHSSHTRQTLMGIQSSLHQQKLRHLPKILYQLKKIRQQLAA